MRLSEVVIVVLVAAIVFAIWSRRSKPASITPSTAPAPTRALDDEAIRSITALIAADRKIHAIKLYREVTGSGLKEAKDAIDAWDPSTGSGIASGPGGANDELAIGARAVRQTSGDIAAIKYVRSETGWGLIEAKNYVEQLGPV